MLCPHCGKGIPNDSVSCPVCNRTIRIEKHDTPKASAPVTPAPDLRTRIPTRLSGPRNTVPPVNLPDEISDLFSEWQRQKAERNFLGVVDTGLQLLFFSDLPPQIARMVRNAIAEAYALRLKREHLEETSVAARRDLISAEIERSPKRADLYWLRGLNEGGYGLAVNMVGWHWWEPIYADIEVALDLDDTVAHYWWARGHVLSRSWQRPPIVEHAVLVEMELSDLDRAIELDPAVAFFYADRAWVYHHYKLDYPRTEADYTKAIELERESVALAHYLAERGNVRAMEWLSGPIDSTALLEGTIEDFGRAIDLNPDVPSYHSERAGWCFSVAVVCAGRAHTNPSLLDRARTYCDLGITESTKAIELQPTSDYYHLRGRLKKHKGDYGGAITDFIEALARNPWADQPVSGCKMLVERGECYVKLRHFYAAIRDFTRAIDILTELASHDRDGVGQRSDEIDEELAKCYDVRAACYVEEGRLSDAISDLTSALGTKWIERVNGQTGLYLRRLELHQQMGDLDGEAEDRKAIWILHPLDFDYENLYFFEEQHDYKSVLELYTYTINANPDNPDMYDRRSRAYMSAFYEAMENKDDDGEVDMDEDYPLLALLDMNKAIELDPLESSYYRYRALLHEGFGQEEEAQRDRMMYEELKQRKRD